MLQRIKHLLLVIIGFLFLNGFSCEESEFSTPVYAHDWQGQWVDNTGAAPFLSTGPIARLAAGIRLSAKLDAVGQATLSGPVENEFFVLQPAIQKIQFFTLNGFDGLPPGADISDRFRLRADYRDGNNLYYLPVNASPEFLNNPFPAWGQDYYADFLLTSPPTQAGLFETSVKITFDSTALPPVDTSFNLPVILLQ